MARKSMKRLNKKTTPRIRSKQKINYEEEQPINFHASSRRILYKKIAGGFNVTEKEIKNKMDGYLNAIINEDPNIDNWWNGDNCGFTSGLCLWDNCCNGSASANGNWSINCKRRIPNDAFTK